MKRDHKSEKGTARGNEVNQIVWMTAGQRARKGKLIDKYEKGRGAEGRGLHLLGVKKDRDGERNSWEQITKDGGKSGIHHRI